MIAWKSVHADFIIIIVFNLCDQIAALDSFYIDHLLIKLPLLLFSCQGLRGCSDKSSGVKPYLLRCPSPL